MTRGRALVVLPIAMLLAIVAIRAMSFVAPRDHPLHSLQPWFSAHPEALIDRGMGEIGAAAARNGSVPPSARRMIAQAARKAPLAAEPFLVEGTIAQMDGAGDRAENLFLAARTRDPRAPAARYFLADRYLRTNRIAAGLVEISALSRLSPRSSEPLGPALASYAKSPGAAPVLRRFFRTDPATRDLVLWVLADDPANTSLILSLAPTTPGRPGPSPQWQGKLVQSLVAAGNYAAAEQVWRQTTGIANRGLLFNPRFRAMNAPPPFNWQYTSGSGGVAEPSGGGGLDVIYYGREEVSLAAQTLRLAPGSYRLAMRIEAPSSAAGLEWIVSCVGSKRQVFRLPLVSARNGALAGEFAVPTDCPAQMLELRGKPPESSETAQLTISDLKLDWLGVKS